MIVIGRPFFREGRAVDIFRPEYPGGGVQDLGLEDGPKELPKGQAVVLEEAGHSKGGRGQDADPTGGFLAQDRPQDQGCLLYTSPSPRD